MSQRTHRGASYLLALFDAEHPWPFAVKQHCAEAVEALRVTAEVKMRAHARRFP